MDTANPTEADLPLPSAGASVPERIVIFTLHSPPFLTKKSLVWFVQIEERFQLRCITSQSSSYLHVVSCLLTEIADGLTDILADPREEDQY